MASHTGAPVPAAAELFRQFVYVVLSANGDAHAKNVWLLNRDGEWVVSPAYDVPSTYPYRDSTLALTVASQRRGQLSRRMALDVATKLRIHERAATKILDDACARFEPWIDRVEDIGFDQHTTTRLRRFLRSRHQALTSTG